MKCQPEFFMNLNAENNSGYFGDPMSGKCKRLSDNTFYIPERELTVKTEYAECGKTGAVRQRTVLENNGSKEWCVETLSSAGVRLRNRKRRVKAVEKKQVYYTLRLLLLAGGSAVKSRFC